MKKALELPEIKERFAAQGFAAAYSTTDAYAKFINAEVDKWAKVVKVSGATID
jgi:tripartite-type tricarboxylate transporter receptor subunit TctC